MPGGTPVTPVDNNGAVIGTVSSPSSNRSVGSATLSTAQANSSTSPAAATLIVPARAGRQSVVISNITGTQPVYLGANGVLVTTGLFVAGAVGASVSIPTAAAVYATSPTAAQTLSYMETY